MIDHKKEDTSDYRQKIWIKEYINRKNLPSTKNDKPSRVLVDFITQVSPKVKDFALDLGSGNGRNSIYLAKLGYKKVLGIEIVEEAIKNAKEKARSLNLDGKVKFINQSVASKIDAPKASFDLVIDMMVMHCLTKNDRDKMIKQVKKLIKPGGYFVFYTISTESEAAIDMIKKNPGSEETSYRFKIENDIVTEKAFAKDELISMLSPLKLVTLELKEEFMPAFGDIYKRAYYYGVFKKEK